ncbi:MAG: hypothetical protein M1833_004286 [Piccolia ochrophora]|nr:MAG: hypothetical protein M1833_004286 [Piccolia ochrophora]
MADPFEVRMRFTSHLQHLNASVTSSQKAAQYALKYREMDEDLHSCILEQLERNSMNNRANIMYFIEHLCDMAAREGHSRFVRMMQQDILRVVDAVTPEDGSGAANVKVVRRVSLAPNIYILNRALKTSEPRMADDSEPSEQVLKGLEQKSHLQSQTVSEIEGALKERDTLPAHAGLSPIPSTANIPPSSGQPGTSTTNPDNDAARQQSTATTGTATPASSKAPVNGPTRPDKRQIEQRIEEDRERHKRLRESIWAVPADNDNAEFYKMWEETSEIGEDDYLAAAEEAAERDKCAELAMAEYAEEDGDEEGDEEYEDEDEEPGEE